MRLGKNGARLLEVYVEDPTEGELDIFDGHVLMENDGSMVLRQKLLGIRINSWIQHQVKGYTT